MRKSTKEIVRMKEDDIAQTGAEDRNLLSGLLRDSKLNVESLLTEVHRARRLALATIENIEKTESHSKVTKHINIAILGALFLSVMVTVFGLG